MARKSTIASNRTDSQRTGNRRKRLLRNVQADYSLSNQSLRDFNYRKLARDIGSNRVLWGVGIGVGAFFALRFAVRYYKAHPEIAEFLRDNLDTIEDKFSEFKRNYTEEHVANARH